MNGMSELLLNPITIIGTLLAVTFISMGYLRHLGVKHALSEKNKIKPYKVSSPYTLGTTPAATPAASTLKPAESTTEPHKKIFRQLGSTGHTYEEKVGYIWE